MEDTSGAAPMDTAHDDAAAGAGAAECEQQDAAAQQDGAAAQQPEDEGPAETEEKYEFDAPKSYDFEVASPSAQTVDQWFEHRNTDLELMPPAELQVTSDDAAAAHGAAADDAQAAEQAQAREPEQQEPDTQEPDTQQEPAQAQPSAGAKRLRPKRSARLQRAAAHHKVLGPAGGAIRKQRPATAKTRHAAQAAVEAETGARDWSKSLRSRSSAVPTATAGSRALTIPESPKLGSTHRGRAAGALTTEEAELQQIQKALQEKQRKKDEDAKRLRKLQSARRRGGAPAKAPTEAVGFTFETERRPRAAARKPAQAQEVRKAAPPRNAGLTVAKSPAFSRMSARRKDVESTAQREEREMAEMRPFKARPVDYRAIDSCGERGVPRVEAKPVTEPSAPKLKTEARVQQHQSKQQQREARREREQEQQRQARKASAAAKIIQQAPAPAPAPTVPMSPCLSYKTAVPRGGVAAAQCSDESRAEFKAKPVPRFEPPSDSRPEPSVTVPKPFALQTDQRGTLKSRQMHEQIEAQQAKERSQREVQATSMHISPQAVAAPATSQQVALTSPRPFELQSAAAHEMKQAELEQKKRKMEEDIEAQQQQFKARPAPSFGSVSVEEATARKASEVPVTVAQSPTLASAGRCTDRALFNEQVKEAEAKRQAAEEEAKRKEAAQQAEELADLRKQLVYQAKEAPVPRAPLEIRPSNAPLTAPESPAWQPMNR